MIREDETNLCEPGKVVLGVGCQATLNKMIKPKNKENLLKFDNDKKKFQIECQTILKTIILHLLDKCPLQSKFVRGISCLSPYTMSSVDLAKKRAVIALEELINLNHFSSVEAEILEREYSEFIEDNNIINKLAKFDSRKDRLDIFLINLCKEKDS